MPTTAGRCVRPRREPGAFGAGSSESTRGCTRVGSRPITKATASWPTTEQREAAIERISASATECPAVLERKKPTCGAWRCRSADGGRRDSSPVPPAPARPVVRHPLGSFDPNQPGTSQEVFLVACKPFVYKHLQWRRGESKLHIRVAKPRLRLRHSGFRTSRVTSDNMRRHPLTPRFQEPARK